MRSRFSLFALVASLAVIPAAAAVAAADDSARKLSFDVFLDDRAIGYQRFVLASTGEGIRIETRAEFEVKLLRITAFEYDHRNTELWRDGCLQAIDARTDSNGKQYAVSGKARGAAFVVATNEGERRLGGCVASFAYWDSQLLTQRRELLNSQTGEYVPVRIDSLGGDRIRIGEREVPVERYSLKGKEIDITLAYEAGSGEWVALDSRLEGGRTLRYRRDPADLVGSSVTQLARASTEKEPSR
jgi:hypothetical protein